MVSACTGTRGLENAGMAEAAAPPGARSVADGVFTRRQALRGQLRFQQVCAACHRPVEITSLWFRAASHRTVGDMYELISSTMPESDPGSLSADEYADILAFVLSAKQYPAGDEELPTDPAALETVFLLQR
jgi:mono/diheme cytochrome c family protein